MASSSDASGYAVGETPVDVTQVVGDETIASLLVDDIVEEEKSSSESEGEQTEGSDTEDEEGDDEKSPKSRDGDDADDAGDGDGSGGAFATIPASSDAPPSEFVDDDFNTRFENAKTLDDLIALSKDSKARGVFYVKIYTKAEEIIKKKKKEMKKRETAEKRKIEKERLQLERAQIREVDITVNIRFSGGNTYPLTTTPSSTIGSLVLDVVDLLKKLGKESTGKKPTVKKNTIRLIHQIDTITERPRRTVGAWGIVDGAVIDLSLGIQGGGGKKRLSTGSFKTSYEEKLQEIKDELMLASVRGKMQPLPHIAAIIEQLDNLKNSILQNPSNINDFFISLQLPSLMKMHSLMGNTNTDLKIGNISKLGFAVFHEQIMENQRQLVVCEKMTKLNTQMMLLMKYANDENPTIQWQSMSKDLTALISTKSHNEGVEATKVDASKASWNIESFIWFVAWGVPSTSFVLMVEIDTSISANCIHYFQPFWWVSIWKFLLQFPQQNLRFSWK